MAGPELDAWAEAVCREFGLSTDDCDVTMVLDLARDAAHAVMRPAAPLTTFLVGVAVGRGLSLEQATARASALAATWLDSQVDIAI